MGEEHPGAIRSHAERGPAAHLRAADAQVRGATGLHLEKTVSRGLPLLRKQLPQGLQVRRRSIRDNPIVHRTLAPVAPRISAEGAGFWREIFLICRLEK